MQSLNFNANNNNNNNYYSNNNNNVHPDDQEMKINDPTSIHHRGNAKNKSPQYEADKMENDERGNTNNNSETSEYTDFGESDRDDDADEPGSDVITDSDSEEAEDDEIDAMQSENNYNNNNSNSNSNYLDDKYRTWKRSERKKSATNVNTTYGPVSARHGWDGPFIRSHGKHYRNTKLRDALNKKGEMKPDNLSYEAYFVGLRDQGKLSDAKIAQALLDSKDPGFTIKQRRAAAMLTGTVHLAEKWRKEKAVPLFQSRLKRVVAGKLSLKDAILKYAFAKRPGGAKAGRERLKRYKEFLNRTPKRKGDTSDEDTHAFWPSGAGSSTDSEMNVTKEAARQLDKKERLARKKTADSKRQLDKKERPARKKPADSKQPTLDSFLKNNNSNSNSNRRKKTSEYYARSYDLASSRNNNNSNGFGNRNLNNNNSANNNSRNYTDLTHEDQSDLGEDENQQPNLISNANFANNNSSIYIDLTGEDQTHLDEDKEQQLNLSSNINSNKRRKQ